MRKLAIIFIIAVLAPSLTLAWLALRSLEHQEMVVQSQLALLHQSRTDAMAGDMRVTMDDIRGYFAALVNELVEEEGEDLVLRNFDSLVTDRWGQAFAACVVTSDGEMVSPDPNSPDPRLQQFMQTNRLFLTNRVEAEVFPAPRAIGNMIQFDVGINATARTGSVESEVKSQGKVSVIPEKLRSVPLFNSRSSQTAESPAPAMEKAESSSNYERRVEPFAQLGHGGWNQAAEIAQQALGFEEEGSANRSVLQAEAGGVTELIGDEPEGALSRFHQDGLHVLLWYRIPDREEFIYWVELNLEEIRQDLAEVIRFASPGPRQEVEACYALLDADGIPVAQTLADFSTDWKAPFVATEVGEILPHWEVTAYLLDPSQVASSARTARLTLWLLVPILLSAIGFGCVLIFRDVSREMQAARQKTDFVSNVSHELKTPLTSIRMFSDLLSQSGDSSKTMEPEKVGNYAGIISTEAGRLTRLINNLLDFSRMERGEKKYDMTTLKVADLVSEIVEHYRLQIEAEGITLTFSNDLEGEGIVEGDRDALSQVLVNLLSNAEKYGGSGGEIDVVVGPSTSCDEIEVRVLDRGPGISRREAARIFEKFYRVDDSLSTGIQGSGLGLTLARQIATAHGGDVEYCDRPDRQSGSCFVLRLPRKQA